MPHSLFSTDTDLTAENLLRLTVEFGCPVRVTMRKLFVGRLQR
ncbi:hypothetical protein ACNKHR_18940 [Shigella flexneri]